MFLLPPVLAVTNADRAEHYRWGDCCDGWFLVKNDQMNVIQEKMPPGSSEKIQVHRKAQQFFFVLAGEAILEAGGREVVLHEREGVLVPPGVPHRIQNRSQRELDFLVTSQPPRHGDREDSI